MKAVDIVKPPVKTEQEMHDRWRNRIQSELTVLNRYRVKIKVKEERVSDLEDEVVEMDEDRKNEIAHDSEQDEENVEEDSE